MAYARPRGSGIFVGVTLIVFGAAFLLHNYRGYEFHTVLLHWWPLLLIFLGLAKLYENTSGRSVEAGASRITGGEIFLIIGLLVLVGIVISIDTVKDKIHGENFDFGGFGKTAYDYDLDVAPKPIAANARVVVRATRGDVTVRASDQHEISVSGKKRVRAWDQRDAEKISNRVSVEVAQNGDGYEIRPTGSGTNDSDLGLDMDIVVPKKSPLTIRSEKGDIQISDIVGPVMINGMNGDADLHNISGDVNIDMRHGDVKIGDTKGDIKLSGKGGEVDVNDATGSLTVDGEFYGPIRADKIARGVRYISQRSDLTLTQLGGHLELGSGNLEIADAPGNLQLRTNRYDLDIENVGGKAKIDNRDGRVELRYSSPPKDDIEITDTNATISLSLPASSSFEIIADCHSCDINSDFSAATLSKSSSGSGDNHLVGTYGNGRPTKISLKTSYGSISLRETSGNEPVALPQRPKMPNPPPPHSPAEVPDAQEN